MINLEAFDPFLEQPKNAELVEQKLYGIVLLDEKANTWTPTTITAEDLVKYEHVVFEHIEDGETKDKLIAESALLAHDECPSWPLVKLVQW
jgi:hypothetical protein